jgi:organic radical activating enzyme
MNKQAKISEIFESLQGEGIYLGFRQVFIRFFGCNLQCAFCDTQLKSFQEYSVDQVRDQILKFKDYHSICLTGGEPLLQAEFIESLLDAIKDLKKKIYLETNGTLFKELERVIDRLDIISMDFKLPSVTKNGDHWSAHEEFLKKSIAKDVFIKIVIGPEVVKTEIERSIEIIKGLRPEARIVLQPSWLDFNRELLFLMESVCNLFLKGGILHVEIMPQAHKLAQVK